MCQDDVGREYVYVTMIGERRVKVNISSELSIGSIDVNAWGRAGIE
jgi:hypothetical protein